MPRVPTNSTARAVTDLLGLEQKAFQKLNRRTWVDPEARWLYLATPKAACTTVKFVLQHASGLEIPEVSGPIHARHPDGGPWVRSIGHLDPETAHEALLGDSFYRFAFVRNPFTRVLSAFKDKFLRNRDAHYTRLRARVFGERAHELDGATPNERSKEAFEVFVRFVAETPDVHRDGHWQSQERLLHLDTLRYELIGRFEHFAADMDIVFERLEASDETRALVETKRNVTNADADCAEWYTPATRDAILTAFESDFVRFDYAETPSAAPAVKAGARQS